MNPRLDRRRLLELVAGAGLGAVWPGFGTASVADAQSASTPWDTFQGDSGRTGYAPDGEGPTENPRIKWFYRTNFAPTLRGSNPLVFDDAVYALARTPTDDPALSGDRQVVAVDRADGSELWRSDLPPDGITGGLAASEQTLYLNGLNDLQAIDRETGRRRWSTEEYDRNLNLSPGGSPLAVDGTLYVLGTASGEESGLFAFDGETGESRWRLQLDGLRFPGAPAYHDGTVYVAADDGQALTAVDIETRAKRWQFEAGTTLEDVSPTVRDGTVYAVGDGMLYAVDAQSGTEQWNWDTSTSPSSLAVTGDTVLNGQAQGIAAFDAGTGIEQWQTDRAGGYGSPPLVVGDTVYAPLGVREGLLAAFDLETGAEQWAIPIGSRPDTGVSYYDGHLYVNDGGRLFAIETGDSSQSSPPEPAISHEPEYAENGEDVTFTATSESGSIDRYLWRIGGVLRSGNPVDHAFVRGTESSRQVELLAVGPGGAVARATDQVQPSEDGYATVRPPPETATATETSDPATTEPPDQAGANSATPTRGPDTETGSGTSTATGTGTGVPTATRETTDGTGTGPSGDGTDGSGPGTAAFLALGGGGGLVTLLGLYAVARRTGGSTESDATGADRPASDVTGADRPASDVTGTGRAEAAETADRDGEYERLISAARDARDSGEYDRALSNCEEALSVAKRRRDQGDGTGHGSRVERAESLAASIEDERHAYRLVTEGLDRVDEELERASETLDGGQTKAALDRLEDVSSALEKGRALVEKHGFSDVSGRLTEQAHRCETLRARAERRRETTAAAGIPESIPSSPSVDLGSTDFDPASSPAADAPVVGRGPSSVVSRHTVSAESEEMPVAVKEPPVDGTLQADAVERRTERAETWQRIDDHDHVVSVVDYGAQPLPWIAMEYMDAGHLGDRAGDLPVEQALWTALSVTQAVRHAHRRGVFHLRLVPENVLFRSRSGAWDVPKVADWGVSRELAPTLDRTPGARHSYAPPEQIDDGYGPVDDVTDVYQLGAVFYELFTGRPPYEGKPSRVMHDVLTGRPSPPSEIADVPDALDELLLCALATEKADRYESVIYLRDELEDLFRDHGAG